MSVLDRRVKQGREKAPSSSSPLSSSDPLSSPAAHFPYTSGLSDLGNDGGLPDVHPSLIEYLNQEAVRRALEQRKDCDEIFGSPNSNASASASNRGHQSSELSLSYQMQTSAAFGTNPHPPSSYPSIHDENLYPRGSNIVPSLRADTTNITHLTHFGVPNPALTAFNIPELEGTGSLNEAFTNVDWFSFMRDCGIMDITGDD